MADPFLTGFLPAAVQELTNYLGRQPAGVLPIVLSSTDIHEVRFPPDRAEVRALDDPFEPRLLDDDIDEIQLGWETYAHGICTVAHTDQVPPSCPSNWK